MAKRSNLPRALDDTLVGTYPALVGAGGGLVWDAVLEYRVWCHPERGAPDLEGGSDYYYAFPSYEEALDFAFRLVYAMCAHRVVHGEHLESARPLPWRRLTEELAVTVRRYLLG